MDSIGDYINGAETTARQQIQKQDSNLYGNKVNPDLIFIEGFYHKKVYYSNRK